MKLSNHTLLQSKIFINNQWLDATSKHTFEVINPADLSVINSVADAGEEDTLKAIGAAAEAFKTWSRQTAKSRAQVLRKWFDLITQNEEDLAVLMTSEQGKPLPESRGEVAYGASFIEWFAEEAKRMYGDVIPTPAAGKRLMTLKQPVGVVAAITPWNFPIAMITRKIAPALAAGCTVVVKPAEDTPLCALALAQLSIEAGLPPGVLNVLPTSDAAGTGKLLTTHPAIAKVSFTGSTEIGRLLMRQSSSTVKKMSLELGGNAPVIVFDDANLEVAVTGAIAAKYRNSGQTCVAANRILVQKSILSKFTEAFTTAAAALQVGNGMDEGISIGPLINKEALAKVERLVTDAQNKGAAVALGGKRQAGEGYYFQNTVLVHCTPGMQLNKEEIFGPVSAIFGFETEEEALALANDTEFGLAAYFFTQNIHRAWRVAEQLQYGMVGINEGLISHAEAPFGGVKQSGYGREGSKYGMEEYLSIKYICLGNMG